MATADMDRVIATAVEDGAEQGKDMGEPPMRREAIDWATAGVTAAQLEAAMGLWALWPKDPKAVSRCGIVHLRGTGAFAVTARRYWRDAAGAPWVDYTLYGLCPRADWKGPAYEHAADLPGFGSKAPVNVLLGGLVVWDGAGGTDKWVIRFGGELCVKAPGKEEGKDTGKMPVAREGQAARGKKSLCSLLHGGRGGAKKPAVAGKGGGN